MDLEERVIREVKIRAANVSKEKRETDKNLERWAEEQMSGSTPLQQGNLTFTNWYKGKMGAKQ